MTSSRRSAGESREFASGQDVSERTRMEEVLRRRSEELAALNAIGRRIVQGLSPDQVAQEAATTFATAARADLALVFLREGARLILKGIAPVDGGQAFAGFPEHRVGECLCGLAVKEARTLCSRDLFADSRCSWEECKRSGLRSFAAVPLRDGETILGMIGLANRTERDFEPDLQFLETMAGLVASACRNAQLYEEVQRELAERKRAEEALQDRNRFIETLLRAIPVAVFFKDRAGRYLGCNRVFTDILGVSNEALVGRTVFDIWPSEHARTYHQRDLELMRLRQHQVYEYEVRDKEGVIRPVIYAKDVFCEANGEVAGLVGAFLDITERKAAEEALRKSEEKYRSLVETTDTGYVIIDGNGLVLDANPEYVRLSGHDHLSQIVGRSVLEWTAEADKDGNAEAVRACLANGSIRNFVTNYVNREGGLQPIELSATSVPVGGGVHIITLCRDIREHKRMEAELLQANLMLESLLDAIPDVIGVQDLEHRMIRFNAAGYALLGQTPEGIAGKRCFEILGNQVPCHLCATLETYQTKRPARVEKLVSELGAWLEARSYPVLDANGQLRFVIEHLRDITERKRTEEALRRERSLLADITETSPVGITTIDREGRITFANHHAERILGLPRDGILGRHYNAPEWRITGLDGQPFPEPDLPFVRVMATSQPVHDVRHSILWPNGRRRDLSIYAAPMRDETGALIGMVAAMIDITEQRLLEERLRQSDKLTAIGQLAGGIAHDFNNQLAGVLGYAELLLRHLDDPKLKQYATGIHTAALRAADLTQQLLAFSRKGKYLSVSINLHTIIAEVVTILEHSIDKRIELRQDLQANPHHVLGDPTQLQGALLNLALNARDAMPGGGLLTFATTVVDLAVDPVNPELRPGRFLQVCVTDTGCGMDADVQKHLFEPFFTTKERGKGTGLGLAAVHGAVKNHHGAIFVESQVGRGTTFRVCLPIHEVPAAARDSGETLATAHRGGAHILVIDDEKVVRDTAAETLRLLGYQVTTCANGAEAVHHYRHAWPYIDLVLLDMVMPRMSGHETFVALRTINPQIRAILSSGHSLDGEAQRILDEGLLGFLQKPYRSTDLAQKVASALGGGPVPLYP